MEPSISIETSPTPRETSAPGSFRRILVPVYFDESSMAALDYAAHLARSENGTVHLLHVVPTDELHLLREVYHPEESGGADVDSAERVARDRLVSLARDRLAGTRCEIVTARDRDPVRGILEMEERVAADLVVLATHGRTGLSHLILRSVAERLVRESKRPVMTTRRGIDGIGDRPFRSILCPVDIDERFTRSLEIARAIALREQAKVYALHVVPTDDIFLKRDVYRQEPSLPPNLVTAERVARARLGELADDILHDVPHDIVLHTSPDAARTILETERDVRADLLVMSTHGFSGIFHLILGSVTETMVRRASCPVLSVRTP